MVSKRLFTRSLQGIKFIKEISLKKWYDFVNRPSAAQPPCDLLYINYGL